MPGWVAYTGPISSTAAANRSPIAHWMLPSSLFNWLTASIRSSGRGGKLFTTHSYLFPPVPQVILPGLLEFTLRLGYRRALRHASGSVKRITDVYVAVRRARQSIEDHAKLIIRVHRISFVLHDAVVTSSLPRPSPAPPRLMECSAPPSRSCACTNTPPAPPASSPSRTSSPHRRRCSS